MGSSSVARKSDKWYSMRTREGGGRAGGVDQSGKGGTKGRAVMVHGRRGKRSALAGEEKEEPKERGPKDQESSQTRDGGWGRPADRGWSGVDKLR